MATDKNNDIIEIACPLCNQTHKYVLDVIRSRVLLDFGSADTGPTEIAFTRLFTCPTKNELFQSRLILRQQLGTLIDDVRVLQLQLAGDSTTDAPPPDVKKKKKGKR